MFRNKRGETTAASVAASENEHELTRILPSAMTPTPADYSLNNLQELINQLYEEAKDQEHLKLFADQLMALHQYLHERFSQQLSTGMKDEKAKTFLNETILLLQHLNRIKNNFQKNAELLIQTNPTGLATLVETTFVAQTVAMLDYEKNCKDAARLSGYGLKIFCCVVITGIFAILGAIAGIGIGLLLTGGIPTPLALATLTHGSITGATLGAAIGGWLLGIPSFFASQHFLFKPVGLTKHLIDVVTVGQKTFDEDKRQRESFLLN